MPLAELQLAIRMLQSRGQPVRLDGWRRRILPRLSDQARMVLSLVPSVGWAPTFLGPGRTGTPEELFEQVRATPSATVGAALADIAQKQPVPGWARLLADDPELRGRLYDGLEHLYAELVGPHWQRLADFFAADRALRMRHLLAGGIERLLSQANPQWMRWNAPVLEVRMINSRDYDLHLEGQGVLLVPSIFASRSMVDDDPAQPQVTYPVSDELSLKRLTALVPEQKAQDSGGALVALLGNTRAAVLNVITEHPGCTTGELATLTGTTSPSASRHASVLREAGLVQTVRHRNTALHTATALGMALVRNPNGTLSQV
ncbi:winged helix-turn-helix domain-containing protein [Sphaerisporangium fuscum]|uniref:winged helix-turn-helix domain-containing protein n=1 Tax=Sphaerisporangium fuscum TaxID=2835868 RepID=UPI001BDD5A1F|nr:winged helix-turn-helix domain-containing protein [Sphaerisporangium fuscum]